MAALSWPMINPKAAKSTNDVRAILYDAGGHDQDVELDVRTVVFAGEALSADLVHKVRKAFPDVRVINAYGQTESFYASTFTLPQQWTETGAIPVGQPLANMRAYVLGPELTPLPPGVAMTSTQLERSSSSQARAERA